MTFDEAISYMNKYQCLPLCEHGNHLIDWAREVLTPQCGCCLTQDAPDFGDALAESELSNDDLDPLFDII